MKLLPSLSALAFLAASTGLASATTINPLSTPTTITLASYGSTNVAPSGVGNSATVFTGGLVDFILPIGGGPTYNVGTGNVWAAPGGSSSWVSNNRGNYPGGSNTEPTGVYDYSTTFFDNLASTSYGTITVLADDTASVYLNGNLIAPAASPATAGTCDSGTPNCTVPATYNLTGFVNGVNTLSFDVLQEHGSAEGLDFYGSVSTSVTPEPNSLLLMGTGILGCASLLYRRRVQA